MELTIKNAISFAEMAHLGQVDRAGVDYMNHVMAVYKNAKSMGGSDVALISAILHDTVEDTEATIEEIEMCFGSDIARVVSLVTKVGASDADYYAGIKSDKDATLVKIADMTHNRDMTRLDVIGPDDIARVEKYKKWYSYLMN